MLGRVHHLLGNLDSTAYYWTRAAMEGDVYNRFAGRAVDSLKAVFGLKDDRELLDFCRKKVGYVGITFGNATGATGLDGVGGGRVAWGDFNSDGSDELLAGGSQLFAYSGGAFKDITEAAGLKAEGCHGGVWGDYDNGGKLDLFTFSSSGDRSKSERLFHNDGNGHFTDVTTLSPDLPDSFSTESAIWLDANGDGRLDLYIPGYERPAKDANDLGNAWPSRLMVQDESGLFHDSTTIYGITPPNGRNLCGRSPVACDFDRDGDQDLYVGNYRLQQNQFWVKNANADANANADSNPKSKIQNPKFTDLAALYEVDGEETDGWWGHTIGCEWGDFDGDGDFDLIACNLAHPRYIGFSNRTMLYRNDAVTPPPTPPASGGGAGATPPTPPSIEGGDSGHSPLLLKGGNEGGLDRNAAPFTNVRKQWGIKYEECHSEPVWGDFDNDGDLDLYITCVYPNRRSFLYENKGDHFEDVTFLSGTRTFNGWGCATSDYNNDGKLDLAVCSEGKIQLFENVTEKAGNWVEVALDPTPGSQLTRVGTIVTVNTGDRKIVRQIEGGKGAGSQNSLTQHFGIGNAKACQVWVSIGGRDVHTADIPANTRFAAKHQEVQLRIR